MSGPSWFDHEWATNQLAANQVGWDWFSLQLDDGSDLMLFHFRTKNGGRDPNSCGHFRRCDRGLATPLARPTLRSNPIETWSAPNRRPSIPVEMADHDPAVELRLDVGAALKDQELRLKPSPTGKVPFALRALPTQGDVKGSGYLRNDGYARPIAGIQAEPDRSTEASICNATLRGAARPIADAAKARQCLKRGLIESLSLSQDAGSRDSPASPMPRETGRFFSFGLRRLKFCRTGAAPRRRRILTATDRLSVRTPMKGRLRYRSLNPDRSRRQTRSGCRSPRNRLQQDAVRSIFLRSRTQTLMLRALLSQQGAREWHVR